MENKEIRVELSLNPNLFLEAVNSLENGKNHVACFASDLPESYCQRLVYEGTNMIPGPLVDRVNKARDVGCLFPHFNLSILPTVDAKSPEASIFLIKSLKELIFEANEKYVHADQILIMMDPEINLNLNSLVVALRAALSDEPDDAGHNARKLIYLKSIILFIN